MSIPQIRTEAIEAVGRKILMEYDPSLLSGQPCSVPIETIIETKFDLILEFHTLRMNITGTFTPLVRIEETIVPD